VPEDTRIGINVERLTYYASIYPFADAMKHADGWRDLTSSEGAINLRSDGYPASLNSGQVAWTFLWWDLDGHYPNGTYEVTYEGDGTLVFGGDASNVQSLQAAIGYTRKSFDVVTPAGGVFIQMHDTNPADPIRNMRIQVPGQDYAVNTFHTDFLDQLQGFGIIRFMQWMWTAHNASTTWSQRTRTTYQTQDVDFGVAWEHQIDLANKLNTPAYLTLPPQADDEYVLKFAQLCRRRLTVWPLYVERGNEPWNTNFIEQYNYNLAQANSSTRNIPGGSDYSKVLRFNGVRSVEMFDIIKSVIPSDQLVTVLSCQLANTGVATDPLDYLGAEASKIDALAINAYFGEDLGEHPTAATTVTWSVAQVIAECKNIINGTLKTRLLAFKALATQYGKFMMAYEGGQHLAPDQVDPNGSGETPWKNDATLLALFKACNEDDGMEECYDLLLDIWEQNIGGPLVLFQSHGADSTAGDWGIRRYMDTPLSAAPKARAVHKRLFPG
jgi:hypothetical protein